MSTNLEIADKLDDASNKLMTLRQDILSCLCYESDLKDIDKKIDSICNKIDKIIELVDGN